MADRFFAGGFLYNPLKKEILLHLRDGNTSINPHKWGFFGGLGEGDETPEEACVREWQEELSITVSKEDLKLLCSYRNESFNTMRYAFYMESELKKEEMVLGEGADFDWIPLEKVFEYDLTALTRKDLELFISLQARV